MRLIVVRHYKTTSNENGNIIGWGDSPPVKEWREDIKFVNDKLRKSDINVDRIYTSELIRARRTGQFYANSLNIQNVHHSAELNEINYGDLNKKSKNWVQQHVPEYKKDPDYVFTNGESFRQMQSRCVDYVVNIASKHPDDIVMLVVHAGIIRGLICHFLGLDYASNLKQHVGHRYIGIFDIAGNKCSHYDEAGIESGFVKEGILKLPYDA